MATIAPGLGGTFKAATAEGRALEALIFLQLVEAITDNNPTLENGVTVSVNAETSQLEGTYRIPAQQSINNQGQLIIAAKPYVNGVSVSPGSDNPTFKSTAPEAYLLEVLMYLQLLERNPAKNTKAANNITGTFNSDLELYQGTVQLPVLLALPGSGSIEMSAVEYLST